MSEQKDDTDKQEEESTPRVLIQIIRNYFGDIIEGDKTTVGNMTDVKETAIGTKASATKKKSGSKGPTTQNGGRGNGEESKRRVSTWFFVAGGILFLAAVAYIIVCILLGLCGCKDPVIDELVPTHTNVTVNGTTTITAHATDKDNDPLTYTWSTDHGTVPGGNPGAQIEYTAPSTPGDGTDTVRVTVSDGKGGICKENITLSIQNAP